MQSEVVVGENKSSTGSKSEGPSNSPSDYDVTEKSFQRKANQLRSISMFYNHARRMQLRAKSNERDTITEDESEPALKTYQTLGSFSSPISLDFIPRGTSNQFHFNRHPVNLLKLLSHISSMNIFRDSSPLVKLMNAQGQTVYDKITNQLQLVETSHVEEYMERFSVNSQVRHFFSLLDESSLTSICQFIHQNKERIEEIKLWQNEISLTAYDVCLLSQKPKELTSFLDIFGFEMSPLMKRVQNDNPSFISFFSRTLNMDVLGSHLTERFKEISLHIHRLVQKGSDAAIVKLYSLLKEYIEEMLVHHREFPIETLEACQIKAFPISRETIGLKVKPNYLQKKISNERGTSSSEEIDETLKSSYIYCYRLEFSQSPQFIQNTGLVYFKPLISLEKLFENLTTSMVGSNYEKCTFFQINIPASCSSYPLYLRVFSLTPRGWTPALRINTRPLCLSTKEFEILQTFNRDEFNLVVNIKFQLIDILNQFTMKNLENVIESESASESSNLEENQKLDNQKGDNPNLMNRLYKNIFNASKFTKSCQQSGFYFAFICLQRNSKLKSDYNIATLNDSIPFIRLFNEEISKTDFENIFLWLNRIIVNTKDNIDFQKLLDLSSSIDYSIKSEIRVKLIHSLNYISYCISNENVGSIYPKIFHIKRKRNEFPDEQQNGQTRLGSSDHSNIIIIVKLFQPEEMNTNLGGNLKWNQLKKFTKTLSEEPAHAAASMNSTKKFEYVVTDFLTNESQIFTLISDFIKLGELESRTSVKKGLYMFYLQMLSQIDSLGKCLALNDRDFGYCIPVKFIRRRCFVTDDEWRAIKHHNNIPKMPTTKEKPLSRSQIKFVRKIYSTWKKLGQEMNMPIDEINKSRLYIHEVVHLNNNCSAVVVTPENGKIHQIITNQNTHMMINGKHLWLPLSYLEMKIINHFNKPLYSTFPNVTSALEYIQPIIMQAEKTCIEDDRMVKIKGALKKLTEHRQLLDDVWKEKRWMSKILNRLRSKKNFGEISIEMHRFSNVGIYNRQNDAIADFTNFFDSKIELNSQVDVANVADAELSLPLAINRSAGQVKIFIELASIRGDLNSISLFLNQQVTTKNVIKISLERLCKMKQLHPPAYQDDYCLCVRISEIERILPIEFHPMLLKLPWRAGKLILKRKEDAFRPSNGPCLVISQQTHSHLNRVTVNPEVKIFTN